MYDTCTSRSEIKLHLAVLRQGDYNDHNLNLFLGFGEVKLAKVDCDQLRQPTKAGFFYGKDKDIFIPERDRMKYTITINQFLLLSSKLDLVDCAILDYIYTFCSSASQKVEEKRLTRDDGIWTWITYENIIEDMPILRIKTFSSLSPRIKRLTAQGYIKTRRESNVRMYYQVTPSTEALYISPSASMYKSGEIKLPDRQNEQLDKPIQTNEPSLKSTPNTSSSKRTGPDRQNEQDYYTSDYIITNVIRSKTKKGVSQKTYGKQQLDDIIDMFTKNVGHIPADRMPRRVAHNIEQLIGSFIRRNKEIFFDLRGSDLSFQYVYEKSWEWYSAKKYCTDTEKLETFKLKMKVYLDDIEKKLQKERMVKHESNTSFSYS